MSPSGKRTLAEGEDAGLDAVGQAEYDCVIRELNRLTATVPLDEPWAMPRAEEFDDMTVADWFESQTKNQSLLGFLRLTTRLNFAADPSQISFLYFLFYQCSGDDFETLNTFKNGAQAFLVRETMHHLATRVAKELGKSIVMEAPVSKIVQDASGVTVVSDKRRVASRLCDRGRAAPAFYAHYIQSAAALATRHSGAANADGFGH